MMTSVQIKCGLLQAGVSMKEIAYRAGTHKANISSVVYGRRRWKKVELEIAAALGKTREEVFGLNEKELQQGAENEKQ